MENLLYKIGLGLATVILSVGSFFGFHNPVPIAPEQPLVQNVGATNAVPTVIALFETTLASAISSSATSMTLTSAVDKAGTTFASSTYPFIIDEGTASEEMVIADCTATACTNITRGISVSTGNTSVTALKFAHRRGASVKITDGPQLVILSRIIDGTVGFPNKLTYTTHPTFLNNTELVDKAYVDAVAFGSTPVTVPAGGTGLTTVPQYGLLSGNGTGALIATTSPTVGYITATSTTATSTFSSVITVTGTTATSTLQNTSFGGMVNFASTTATSTFQGGVKLNKSGTGLEFYDGTIQTTAGAGLSAIDWQQLNETSFAGAATTTTATFSARKYLKIIIEAYSVSTNSNLLMTFNGDTAGNYGTSRGAMGGGAISQSAVGDIYLADISSVTAAYFVEVNTSNTSANKKYSFIKAVANNGSAAQAPLYATGSAVWNNTSSQITSISVGTGLSSNTIGSGRITVYGSSN